jgi:hypothetical protein
MDHVEIEELAGHVLGKSEEEIEEGINDGTLTDELEQKYGVDFHLYSEIVKDLLPFTPVVKAGLTGDHYHAFVVLDQPRGMARMIVRKPHKPKTKDD